MFRHIRFPISLIFLKTLFLEPSDQLSFKLASPGISGGASLVVQRVKNLPAMQETWVWSLGWEDALEKEMATHCSILASRTPWTEEPGMLQSDTSVQLSLTGFPPTFIPWFPLPLSTLHFLFLDFHVFPFLSSYYWSTTFNIFPKRVYREVHFWELACLKCLYSALTFNSWFGCM